MKFVLIPAELSEPIQEFNHEGVVELTDDSFIQYIKEYFTKKYSSANIDKGLLKDHLSQHASKQGYDMSKVNDDMMQQLLMMSAVDIFPVLLPLPASKQKGVSVYVDDKGISKGLSVNQRVSSFVQEVGYPGQIFHGDAFMARVHDSEMEDIWKRVDFSIDEVASNAEWVVTAKEQTKNKKSAQEVANFKKQFTSNPVNVQQQQGKQKIEDKVGSTTNYAFRDAGDELELAFLVEAKDKKKVKVVFKPTTLLVMYDGVELFGEESCKATEQEEGTPSTKENTPVSSATTGKGAKLFGAVDTSDCSWSIVDGKKLVVTLMKKGNEQWPTILEA